MLHKNQIGSIIGLALTIVVVIIIGIMITNRYARNNDEQEAETESSSAIEQAREGVDNVNQAGERATNIIDGLRGN